jgi:hypothetical protein
VSSGRGPLTVTGQARIDEWRRLWQQRGAPTLPLLLTGLGEAFTGERALSWLAERLPQHHPIATHPIATQDGAAQTAPFVVDPPRALAEMPPQQRSTHVRA